MNLQILESSVPDFGHQLNGMVVKIREKTSILYPLFTWHLSEATRSTSTSLSVSGPFSLERFRTLILQLSRMSAISGVNRCFLYRVAVHSSNNSPTTNTSNSFPFNWINT